MYTAIPDLKENDPEIVFTNLGIWIGIVNISGKDVPIQRSKAHVLVRYNVYRYKNHLIFGIPNKDGDEIFYKIPNRSTEKINISFKR